MPRLDKTGPWDKGPLTGGGFGRCRPGNFRLRNRFRHHTWFTSDSFEAYRFMPDNLEKYKKQLEEELEHIKKYQEKES